MIICGSKPYWEPKNRDDRTGKGPRTLFYKNTPDNSEPFANKLMVQICAKEAVLSGIIKRGRVGRNERCEASSRKKMFIVIFLHRYWSESGFYFDNIR